MKETQLPYIEQKTIKGKTYNYFRTKRNGKNKYKRLPDNIDSKEFMDEYWAIRAGKVAKPCKTTWNNLIISFYRDPRFRSKAAGTQENYRRHCEAIREKNGDKDMTRFRRKDALKVQTALQDTWSKANERLAVLSILCKLAVDLEWIERNPIVDIPKLHGGEYEAWPDRQLHAFEQYCDLNNRTIARTVYELCIGTGQRLNACVNMTWEDFDGEYMHVVPEKQRKGETKQSLRIYCPKRLRDYLASLPRQGRHILAKNLTQPIGKRAAQKAVEDVRASIGVLSGADRLVPHGWRYTAAKHLAEAGCGDSDIQSVTGHKTLAMVQKYRAQANQEASSKRAQQRREQSRGET